VWGRGCHTQHQTQWNGLWQSYYLTQINWQKQEKRYFKQFATLRLHPPAPFLVPHKCDEMVNICGFKVPIKAQVLVNVWAMGREPTTCWENPEMFMPKRFWQLLGAPSNFAGAPSNMGERAKMSFTL